MPFLPPNQQRQRTEGTSYLMVAYGCLLRLAKAWLKFGRETLYLQVAVT